MSHWQEILPDVLHSIRTLLCTAINCSPHERLFAFSRKSSTGTSLPSWLLDPGPVLLRRFVRHSKQEPLVDEVELLEANPQYAHVRFPDGRETTVSVKDLAPCGEVREPALPEPEKVDIIEPLPAEQGADGGVDHPEEVNSQGDAGVMGSEPTSLRRSTRISKPPARLITEV